MEGKKENKNRILARDGIERLKVNRQVRNGNNKAGEKSSKVRKEYVGSGNKIWNYRRKMNKNGGRIGLYFKKQEKRADILSFLKERMLQIKNRNN